MAGSAIVAKVFQNELYLNSGQRILWGDCTKRVECREGDLVYFSGYLKNGGIHTDTIEKLQLPWEYLHFLLSTYSSLFSNITITRHIIDSIEYLFDERYLHSEDDHHCHQFSHVDEVVGGLKLMKLVVAFVVLGQHLLVLPTWFFYLDQELSYTTGHPPQVLFACKHQLIVFLQELEVHLQVFLGLFQKAHHVVILGWESYIYVMFEVESWTRICQDLPATSKDPKPGRTILQIMVIVD